MYLKDGHLACERSRVSNLIKCVLYNNLCMETRWSVKVWYGMVWYGLHILRVSYFPGE